MILLKNLILSILVLVACLGGREERRYVITAYGATKDTTAVQTAAIQRAINAAARRGGTVVIPAGLWCSEPLYFRPRTHLLLEKGAVLQGVAVETALVHADACDGFSIAGSGTLGGGVVLSRCARVTIRDCQVDCRGDLLTLEGENREVSVEGLKGKAHTVLRSSSWASEDVLIQRCTLSCRRFRDIMDASKDGGPVFRENKWKYTYNKDEAQVKPYALEDPLSFADGTPVRTVCDWKRRRKEILDLFQQEMYGSMPKPRRYSLETLEEGPALEGKAWRRQVRMSFRPDGPSIDWLIVTPVQTERPSPAILMLNFYGNHTTTDDPEVLLPSSWLEDNEQYGIVHHRATERSRGMFTPERSRETVFPIHEMISRGYAFVTACYGDVTPDPADPSLQATLARPGSLIAWAWAMSRGLDMLEEDASIDEDRVVVTGSSRLGKAALLAGAFDERFAIVAPNQTGGGGAPLSKRNFGEYVASEVEHFPHWWSPAYAKYAEAEASQPFDQHLLLSCVAPRPLLVEGFNNPWFDTYGEFLALKAASVVWRFLGAEGLPAVAWPADEETSAIGERVGYVRRSGGHGLFAPDWQWILDFADKIFCVDIQ